MLLQETIIDETNLRASVIRPYDLIVSFTFYFQMDLHIKARLSTQTDCVTIPGHPETLSVQVRLPVRHIYWEFPHLRRHLGIIFFFFQLTLLLLGILNSV